MAVRSQVVGAEVWANDATASDAVTINNSFPMKGGFQPARSIMIRTILFSATSFLKAFRNDNISKRPDTRNMTSTPRLVWSSR